MTFHMHQLPLEKKEIVDKLVALLSQVPGVKAIVLGGSYARGTARKESDVDIGIYYHEDQRLDIEGIKKIALLISESDEIVVTKEYEWGPWVNGGAWIETKIGKIDLLYRNLDQVERVIKEVKNGIIHWDYAQQPPNGFYSVTYLAETNSAVPLFDPKQLLSALKISIEEYPPLLRQIIIQNHLWGAEFTLLYAKKSAKTGDIYSTFGCIARILAHYTQVLFALNCEYFISDKEALEGIEGFTLHPFNYKKRVENIFSNLNLASIQELETLFFEIKDLTQGSYQSKYLLPEV